jgi:hypothetical protein
MEHALVVQPLRALLESEHGLGFVAIGILALLFAGARRAFGPR